MLIAEKTSIEGWSRTMAYAAHPSDCPQYHGGTQHHASGKPGILRRLYQALHAYRQREADRQVAAFIARSGGRLTDSVERELADRMFTGDWQRRWPSTGL